MEQCEALCADVRGNTHTVPGSTRDGLGLGLGLETNLRDKPVNDVDYLNKVRTRQPAVDTEPKKCFFCKSS